MPSKSLHAGRSWLLVVAQFMASGAIVFTTRWTDFTPAVSFVGVSGLGLWGWAVVTMKFSRISIRPEISVGADLVTHGPFRLIRHPMYTGLNLSLLACVLTPFGWWRFLIWVALSIVLLIKSGIEERLLLEQFPGYSDYRRRTKRFVPFLF